MKLYLVILVCLFLSNNFLAQTRDEILAEAYLLYNSEKSSWNGTDIFLEKFPNKQNLIGGYLSYSESNTHSCIFFDRSESPNLLAKITFKEGFIISEAVIDTISRKLNVKEMELFTIRKLAISEMNNDTLFKVYKNTNLNPIPLIIGKKKKVFILTGPKESGVVVLGNDYLLTFDKKNKLKSKKALHKNILIFEYEENLKDQVSMHSHVKSTGNLITSTDICTLLLYQKFANWKQHYVISEKNVSLWDCEKDYLLILTKKAWDRIYDNEKP